MRSRVIRDLIAWEEGELSFDALSGRHEKADIEGTIGMYGLFNQIAAEEFSPPTATQVESLLAELPEKRAPRTFIPSFRVSGARRLVAIVASIFMTGGVAYAAGYTPVREGVDTVVRGIASLFDGSRDNDGSRGGNDPSNDRPAGGNSQGTTSPGESGNEDDSGAGQGPSDDGHSGEGGDDDGTDDRVDDGPSDDGPGDDGRSDEIDDQTDGGDDGGDDGSDDVDQSDNGDDGDDGDDGDTDDVNDNEGADDEGDNGSDNNDPENDLNDNSLNEG